jgi:hypothetical protein
MVKSKINAPGTSTSTTWTQWEKLWECAYNEFNIELHNKEPILALCRSTGKTLNLRNHLESISGEQRLPMARLVAGLELSALKARLLRREIDIHNNNP